MVEKQSRQRLTIICPVYNEKGVVQLFFPRMRAVMDELSKRYDVNLVFSDNRSTDTTLSEVREICDSNPDVFVIALSANVGYQCSMDCALRTCHGDIFGFIDVDGEDPPEMILQLIELYEKGYDIVYGDRVDREEVFIIKFLRKVFYRLLRRVADDEVILDMAEFMVMSREVRDAIINDRTSYPFIRASIGRVGFKRIGIPYKRQQRLSGKSHYNLWTLTKFAVAGILSSSTLLLRLPLYSLPIWLSAVLIATYFWATQGTVWWLLALTALICGYVGCTVSFIGIYVGRTYKNSLGRPNYVIDHKHSLLQPSDVQD